MHLRPVYLVEPKPKPPSIPTRRAFLIAGATLFAGAAAGGACGYAAGSSVDTDPAKRDIAPTGDATLDELRRLAVDAPIDELMSRHMVFLDRLTADYSQDEVLWSGVQRICNEVLSNRDIESRRSVAGWLATVIERGDPNRTSDLRPFIAKLKRVE